MVNVETAVHLRLRRIHHSQFIIHHWCAGTGAAVGDVGLVELGDDDQLELLGVQVLLRNAQNVFLGDGVDALRVGVGVVGCRG